MTATPSPKRPALRYYGGKWRLAPWIIEHFPAHTCYVEPFAGAASVFLRKEPSDIEVINDLNGDVVNFFRILRDHPRELIEALSLTPFSRAEFYASYEPAADPIERARRLFVRCWQGFGANTRERRTGWKFQRVRWENSRADQVSEWLQACELWPIVTRLRRAQIENDDALQVIHRFDSPTTLFYVDPPYLSDSRSDRWCRSAYSHELHGHDHVHLANALHRLKGMAVISSLDCQQYDRLFPTWTKVTRKARTFHKSEATEALYLSPRTAKLVTLT